MTRNEMMNLIDTMNNYDDLAAKDKAKAEEIFRLQADSLVL